MTTKTDNKLVIQLRCSYKIIRFTLLLLFGLITIPLLFSLPYPRHTSNHLLFRQRFFMLWLSKIKSILNIHMSIHGTAMPETGLFVSNHVSWLDVPLQNSQNYAHYIAKQDVKGWPLVGWLTDRIGTIFIDRSNKFSCYRHLSKVENRLTKNCSVFLYPEGTTSDGSAVLPFFTMFYETACRTGVPIQPVMISYTHADGSDCFDAAFINDQSFVNSLLQITALKEVFVTIKYLPPINTKNLTRKQLAAKSYHMISHALSTHRSTNKGQYATTENSTPCEEAQTADCSPL